MGFNKIYPSLPSARQHRHSSAISRTYCTSLNTPLRHKAQPLFTRPLFTRPYKPPQSAIIKPSRVSIPGNIDIHMESIGPRSSRLPSSSQHRTKTPPGKRDALSLPNLASLPCPEESAGCQGPTHENLDGGTGKAQVRWGPESIGWYL
jgi:hypothetical protein